MSESEIFKTAVKLPPQQRQAYLDKACGNNHELRQEVESLLRASDADDSFLEKPAVEPNGLGPTVDVQPLRETAGSRIGPYKLLQQIGEGGMGVVYLAEQQEPVCRKVALKIIKPGMDSRQVVARFEAERQALAIMEHQNIARVLDAGTTETGQPYFVMELVKGVAITKYCDKNQFTPRERLELFVPVCHAVQHAHQKGIIHRDLKPSNVLVCLYDGQPTPKVIDFGVAKATEQRLTEKTMFTQHGQIVGTLEYMSPEQAEMSQLDIDTRSDIYSLGVLLYELLTGSTPITKKQLQEKAFAEMLLMICEQEPVRPSTRLSESGDALPTISAQRKTEPKKLSLLLRGELDLIVMKALEKDRTRRYETANGFARDIQRHLDDEPVEACPPSARYRLHKFARKHRAALATTAAFAALLIVGVVVSTWQAVRATVAQREAKDNLVTATGAQQEAEEAEARAKQDRDRALEAEQQARASAANAVASSEKVKDTLTRSLFQQARAVRLTEQPGRRWLALDLLERAEQLRSRERPVPAMPETGQSSPASEDLPERAQLRSEAVASLLLRDGKVTETWNGHLTGVSPDGRFVAMSSIPSPSDPAGGLRVIDLKSQKDVCKLTGKAIGQRVSVGLAIEPGGKRLVSVTMDKNGPRIQLIDLPSGELSRTLKVPTKSSEQASTQQFEPKSVKVSNARLLAFSPDGRWLLVPMSQMISGIIAVWDLHDESEDAGRVIAVLEGQPLSSASFSHDSRLLAWKSGNKTVTLWDLAENRKLRTIKLPLTVDGSLEFTPDGKRLILHGHLEPKTVEDIHRSPGTVLIWDLETDREDRRFLTLPGFLAMSMGISADGERVALGHVTGTVLLIGLSDGSRVELDHGGMPSTISWSDHDNRLIAAGIGGVKIWALSNETSLSVRKLGADDKGLRISRFAISRDGRRAAVELQETPPQIRLYDMSSGQLSRTLPTDRSGILSGFLSFNSDGTRLVRSNMFRPLQAWDLEGDSKTHNVEASSVKRRTVNSVGFREDGSLLLGGTERLKPMVTDAQTGEIIWQGDSGVPGGGVQISADARLVALHAAKVDEPTRTIERWIEVRDLPGGELRHKLPAADTGPMFQGLLNVSPDNRWLVEVDFNDPLGMARAWGASVGVGIGAVSGADQAWKATLWNLGTGDRQMDIQDHSTVTGWDFSSDGRYFAVSQRSGTVIVWDVDRKERLFDWQARPGTAEMGVSHQVAFTSGGRQLVVVDDSGAALRLLDLDQLDRELDKIGLGW